jgi:hypothetical protein
MFAMPPSIEARLTWFGIALSALLLPGCVFVADHDDFYEPVPPPPLLMYEVCYSSAECLPGLYCEELAVPADYYTDYVSAICTVGCFDDLDCPISEFNGLPGACVDHAWLGGPVTSRICVERCEIDADCDVPAGFGCAVIAGDRLCVPIQ